MQRAVLGRRGLLALAAAGAAGVGRAHAAGYPDQVINFIIPYGPGGSFDSYGRKFAQLLQQGLPSHPNVEPINVPGAAGNKAIFQLLQDPPDGYNISLINAPGIFMSRKGASMDLGKLTWIANLGRDSYGLAVAKDGSIHKVADLQALSAKRPVKFASTGAGSTDFFATKAFADSLGLRTTMVSGYSDSPNSVVAVARGDVDAVVHSLATLKQMETSGLAKILFLFQDKSPLPGVEDATSIGKPDLGAIYQWRPIVGPPNLPPEIVSTLSGALVAAARSPEAQKWAAGLGTELFPLDQAGTLAMVRTQQAMVAKWA